MILSCDELLSLHCVCLRYDCVGFLTTLIRLGSEIHKEIKTEVKVITYCQQERSRRNSASERNKAKEKDINNQIKLTTFFLQAITTHCSVENKTTPCPHT